MQVGEADRPVPVMGCDILSPGSDLVSNRTHHRLRQSTPFFNRQRPSVPSRRYTGSACLQETLTLRVRPQVILSTGCIDGTRGHQCEKHVLIYGKISLPVAILPEIPAEPVRETRVDPCDRLAKSSTRERRAAATGVVGNNQRKTFILGASPQRRFPNRECPITATCVWSTSSSASK